MDKELELQRQEDKSFFVDKPPPGEMQAQAALPVTQPRAEQPVAPPEPVKPKISAHMVGLAESFGLTAEEASSYSSDADLSQALRMAARFRSQPQQRSPEQPRPEEPAAQDWEEIPELHDGYDAGLIELSKKAKKNNAYWKKRFDDLEKRIPEMVQQSHAAHRATETVNQLIADEMMAAGYDKALLTHEVKRKIGNLGSGLHKTLVSMGQEPPDDKALIRMVLSTALGAPTGTTTSSPNSQVISDQQKAMARPKDPETGRFVPINQPGNPTHRASEMNGAGSHLRSALVDGGIDPGPRIVDEDRVFFKK